MIHKKLSEKPTLTADRFYLAGELRHYLARLPHGEARADRTGRPLFAVLANVLVLRLTHTTFWRDEPVIEAAEKLSRHLVRYRLAERYTFLAICCDWILEGNLKALSIWELLW